MQLNLAFIGSLLPPSSVINSLKYYWLTTLNMTSAGQKLRMT